jgi:hypothetical protein
VQYEAHADRQLDCSKVDWKAAASMMSWGVEKVMMTKTLRNGGGCCCCSSIFKTKRQMDEVDQSLFRFYFILHVLYQ